jgi:hypothetical protein
VAISHCDSLPTGYRHHQCTPVCDWLYAGRMKAGLVRPHNRSLCDHGDRNCSKVCRTSRLMRNRRQNFAAPFALREDAKPAAAFWAHHVPWRVGRFQTPFHPSSSSFLYIGAGLNLYSTDSAFFTSLLEYPSFFLSRLTLEERWIFYRVNMSSFIRSVDKSFSSWPDLSSACRRARLSVWASSFQRVSSSVSLSFSASS